MAMARIWTGMVALSLLFGLINGTIGEVANAAIEGAGTAVTLTLTLAGVICLWSGIMEVIRRGGIAAGLSRLLRPALGRLFPESKDNPEAMEALSANVSANLLGLGNAATPLGIRAVQAMKRGSRATDDQCMLVIINTASIQIIPATVAGIRAAAGSGTPFDILPPVWITSILSLAAAITLTKFLARRKAPC
ncbi:MAG: spore maturation protein A [Oscillospiraceae bacterium]|nr:spore maturation protein A [Oscillospiraceae bacterium]